MTYPDPSCDLSQCPQTRGLAHYSFSGQSPGQPSVNGLDSINKAKRPSKVACGGFLERQELPLEPTRCCTDTSVYPMAHSNGQRVVMTLSQRGRWPMLGEGFHFPLCLITERPPLYGPTRTAGTISGHGCGPYSSKPSGIWVGDA